ncbi:tetratricopeptide repeat protein [Flavobacteriaceae bacterium R38]|nr:tetratricopeptide repeat protein [Flavobacteriaceae bacterium R38]
MKNLVIVIITLLTLASCHKKQDSLKVTDLNDYEKFLKSDSNQIKKVMTEVRFWSDRLDNDSTDINALSELASANTTLFNVSGKIEYLKIAEQLWKEGIEHATIEKTSLLRSLAHNYIVQHEFKKAKQILNKAFLISKERETVFMFFDVHMELGNYEAAKDALFKVKDLSDFNYLVRLAKWMKHKGYVNNNTFKYLRRAVKLAEAGALKHEMNWSYSNLADYYSDAGKIEKAYHYYLKALEVNPNDNYALKKIAWMVFSYEKNAEIAYMILNRIKEKYESPDIYLMEAEIAAYEKDFDKKAKSTEAYYKLLNRKSYGEMYNAHNALLYIDKQKDFQKAITIAKREIKNRPTPQSYDLLAWAYYNQGDYNKAFQITKEFIHGKTFKPETLYHQAKILKANAKNKRVKSIKRELKNSLFELGPNFSEKINAL